MKDAYQTIAAPTTGEFRDRGSKFLAYAYAIQTVDEGQQRLEEVRKLHPKARHHCYAYRLGLDQNNFRANDDGEPSGTAGRPILGQIDSFGLSHVLIVVVRYFGGTLLGTSGLINAYKLSAKDALEQATIVERIIEDVFEITFDYAIMSQVMNGVKKLDLQIVLQDFGVIGKLQISIRKSEVDKTLLQLKALIGGMRIEEVDKKTKIEGLKIVAISGD